MDRRDDASAARVPLRLSRRGFMTAAGAAGLLAATGRSALGAQGATAPATPQSGGVNIYPARNTWTASPNTEISFRGITGAQLGSIVVTGSLSGGHSGVLSEHAHGNGVSYLPDAHFLPGDVVTVEAEALADTAHAGHRFGISRPVAYVKPAAERETDAPNVPPHEFRSRPDLQPPVIEITTPAGAGSPGLIFLSPAVDGGQNGALIVDDAGEVVWFSLPAASASRVKDFRVQQYRGQPVLTWSEAAAPIGFGLGHYVICDTAYQRIAELQVGNGFAGGDFHEFLLTSRNTALITLFHAIEWDLSPLGGSRYGWVIDCAVQELEIETGRVLFEWHTLDHIPVIETRVAFSPDDNRDHAFDYFHINSIDEDADGNLYISSRHAFGIYKIDRASGDIVWRLNGVRSDFTLDEDAGFAWQHDARMHPDGQLTLFDNAEANANREGEVWSRGMRLALDEATMTASLVQDYVHPEHVLSTSQGNTQVLPNGNVFVGWGSAPVFSEFTRDGRMIFDGRLPEGASSYRAFRLPWTGEPADPPDIAVETRSGTSATVYASWNGATNVASWQVLAGATAETMQAAGTPVPRNGFETTITVAAPGPYFSVQALDADGTALGTANAVQPASQGRVKERTAQLADSAFDERGA